MPIKDKEGLSHPYTKTRLQWGTNLRSNSTLCFPTVSLQSQYPTTTATLLSQEKEQEEGHSYHLRSYFITLIFEVNAYHVC